MADAIVEAMRRVEVLGEAQLMRDGERAGRAMREEVRDRIWERRRRQAEAAGA